MVGRTSFNGQQQRAVLAALQRRLGKESTQVAGEVGLSYPQFLRYARGHVPLRSDQIARFAEIYGVSEIDLTAALAGDGGLLASLPDPERPQDEGWTFRKALACVLTEALIDELAPQWEGRPLINQRAAVEAIKQMAASRRSESFPSRESHAV